MLVLAQDSLGLPLAEHEPVPLVEPYQELAKLHPTRHISKKQGLQERVSWCIAQPVRAALGHQADFTAVTAVDITSVLAVALKGGTPQLSNQAVGVARTGVVVSPPRDLLQ